MNKYSANSKANSVMLSIEESLLTMCDTEEESLIDIVRYKKEFPNLPDYGLYKNGNLLIYDDDIRELYTDNGYKYTKKLPAEKLRAIYRRHVGQVANHLIYNFKKQKTYYE